MLSDLDSTVEAESTPKQILCEFRDQYQHWHDAAGRQIDAAAEQFPEFVTAMQERLGSRLLLLAENEVLNTSLANGELPRHVGEQLKQEVSHKLRKLRGYETARLKLDPNELLKKVPCFKGMTEDEFAQLAANMKAHTFAAKDIIIRQGDGGDSLYLVARGVVRVSRRIDDAQRDVATLMAGDFFGEMALLHGEPRNATCRAITPCSLYELKTRDLEKLLQENPAMRDALEEADRLRAAAPDV